MKKPEVSIIIVQYHVKELLFACIRSIKQSTTQLTYEIIVVDNDEKKSIKQELLRLFPDVTYIANENNGFGQGNNVGVKKAKGEYLFFLNPDTTVFPLALSSQLHFLRKNEDFGIVAPLLYHPDNSLFELQGMATLTPLRGIVCLSFLNKLFPNNPISRSYWLPRWNKKKIKEVGVVPGTAFMMRKDLYESIGGFDDNFFLYFEEFDLCKRVSDLGYRICMLPEAKVMHVWGESTKHRSDVNAIFQESRFYYFVKHFGLLNALIVEFFARWSRDAMLLSAILVVSTLVALLNSTRGMIFIGDQAWFYNSARDLLIGKDIPLVGITSSHTWLHQGAFWTYLLAVALWIGKYNPLSGLLLSIGFHSLTTFILYILGKKLFSKTTALIASTLYAFSPYLLSLSSMPYHTTPIPFLTILFFYNIAEWVRGKSSSIFWLFFILSILYNFELATLVLVPFFLIVTVYGLITKADYIKALKRSGVVKVLVMALVPMLPVLIYDIGHGYKQTIVFLGWIVFSSANIIFHFKPQQSSLPLDQMISYIQLKLQSLIIISSKWVSNLFFIVSAVIVGVTVFKKRKNLEEISSYVLLLLWILTFFVVFLANKTASDAYLPFIFPAIFLCLAITLNYLLIKNRQIILVAILGILVLNTVALVKFDFFSEYEVALLARREQAVKEIIKISNQQQFSLRGKGMGSQYESFLMPYEYLLWYKGYTVSANSKTVLTVEERGRDIIITKEDD